MIKALPLLLLFSLSCQSHQLPAVKNPVKKNTSAKKEYAIKTGTTNGTAGLYTFAGDTVIVAPFEIEIALSPKARERIVSRHETIIVDVSLDGTPRDSSLREEDGSFSVGSAKKEISYGQIAKFDSLTFPKALYDELVDKDADLTVNVYSGRKTSPDNLLDVDFLSDKVSRIIHRHFILKGKLIYGDD
ncbi:MAG TPA: hypothetical protein VG847_07060 [Chitinophagaceae bacterium]|nr:hypothetical protein [Chitinophagaceae bacterium]